MKTAGRRGPRLPRGEMRERVRVLFEEGLSYREIAEQLDVTKSAVAFHVRRLGILPDTRFSRRYDWEAIRRAYDSGLSRKECMKRFGFGPDAWRVAARRGLVTPRPVARPIEEYLVVGRNTTRTHLKNRLIREGLKENRCENCGITSWCGKPLTMELHHINGNGTDNRLENLRLLCGNCHAQTHTWGGRNAG